MAAELAVPLSDGRSSAAWIFASGAAALAAVSSAFGLTFLAGAAATWLWVVITLTRIRGAEGDFRPLGLATRLTLLRGWLVSAVAGFAVAPAFDGLAAWAPGVLYTVAALCDLVDGYLARKRGEVSAVGARLDVAVDALGLVCGPLAAVALGRLPIWYLALGAAYYVFFGELWLRARRGRPVHLDRLRPSRYTRQFAGCQMGLVATALFPVVGPPATTITAAVFMATPLLLFVRDWLVVVGRLDPDEGARRMGRVGHLLVAVFPLPLRLLGAAGVAALVGAGDLAAPVMVLAATVALGILTRVTSFAAAVAVGLMLPAATGPLPFLTFTALVTLILTGAGPGALWSPEDRLMLRRAGETLDG
jgi:CDP-diacylglycerol--glycerol-3-phosphate 3-phosphatidyltransferase